MKRPLHGKPRCKENSDTAISLNKIRCEGVNWIELAADDRVRWQGFVSSVIHA
jgi:hypothetical protein